MNKLIVYCLGGTGNRLRPIASAQYLAKQLGMELFVCWDPDTRCPASFHDLFSNELNIMTRSDLIKLKNATVFTSQWDIDNEIKCLNTDVLSQLDINGKRSPIGIDALTINDGSDMVFVSNTFLQQAPIEENKKWLKELKPIPEIQEKINQFQGQFPLTKSIIGCSVRGSDINIDIGDYNWQFENTLKGTHYKLFICSDDEAFENYFVGRYWDKCIRRKKQFYSFKVNPQKESYHNNITTTKLGVQEGIIDLYNLAKTSIQIYYKESSFINIAKIIGDQI